MLNPSSSQQDNEDSYESSSGYQSNIKNEKDNNLPLNPDKKDESRENSLLGIANEPLPRQRILPSDEDSEEEVNNKNNTKSKNSISDSKIQKNSPNALAYNIKEDFFIIEKSMEYQEHLRSSSYIRKADFFTPYENFIGRSYSSISKRAERLQNISEMIKFVIFFFAKNFEVISMNRKIIMAQGKEVIIQPKDDGHLPNNEQQFLDKLKAIYKAPTIESIESISSIFQDILKKQGEPTYQDGYLKSKFFIEEIDEQIKNLKELALKSPPLQNEYKIKEEESDQEGKVMNTRRRKLKMANEFALNSENKVENPNLDNNENSSSEKERRPKKTRKNESIRKPTIIGSKVVRIRHEMSAKEAKMFDLVLEKMASKFGIDRKEILGLLKVQEVSLVK